MRITCWGLAAAAALLVSGAPTTAAADDVAREIEELRATVRALQDTVAAQDLRIEQQDEKLADAGLEGRSDRLSGLSDFLETTEFYGWVSGTYNHDLTFESDNDGALNGFTVPFGGTKPNTFSLNQLWFGMDKAPTEESRGGYHVDISYGAISPFNAGSTDTVEIWAAYASYLAPIGNGVQIDMGELWTLIGAEVVDSLGNFNITRGLVWGLQPVNHVGIIASTEVGEGASVALGLVNDPFSDANFDTDNDKAVTGQITYEGAGFYAGLSGIFGSQVEGPAGTPGFEGDKYGLIDVLLTADPSDRLSMWLNYNYNWFEDTPGAFGFAGEGPDSDVHGIAVAARLAVTERMGLALRGEGLFFGLDDVSDEEQFSLTGTLDYQLTEKLTTRGEIRWDTANFDGLTIDQDGVARDDQLLGVVELVYSF